jgi:hypothetical protein
VIWQTILVVAALLLFVWALRRVMRLVVTGK